jgi:type IV pilus assembly protein PilQ
MRKWTKSAGLLFLAVSSVYFGQATGAKAEDQAKSDDPAALSTIAAAPVENSAQVLPDSASTQPSDIIAAAPQSGTTPKVTINDSGTFSIQINNGTNLIELLRMIGSQAQISIVPGKNVSGTVPAMDLYNVTVQEALGAILQTNDMFWEQKGNFIYVYTKDEWAALVKATHHPETRVFHLYYTPAADVEAIIKDMLSEDGKVATTKDAKSGIDSTGGAGVGSDSSSSDTGGNSYSGDDLLIVTDYAEKLDDIARVIKEIDHRPQQILVEATILDAQLTENNSFGIDFTVMGGVNFDTLLTNGASVSQVLSGNVLNPSGTGTSPAAVVKNGYNGVTTGNYDTQVPPGGLQVGVVKNNLGVFLQALESATDATVLANPKVLVLDKQSGKVHVGQELGYNGGSTVTQTSTTSTIAFIDTGTILSFRPYIGNDGYIRMEIHPEDSSGSVDTTANPPLPNKSITEITSNVMVKDGNTIVIGGLFRDDITSSKSQIPILGNLPWIGFLFRNKADSTTRHEVIILLTPHIIKDDQAYSRISDEELAEADKLRVGVRKEMMWSGRTRLAESAYEAAVDEMSKPNPDINAAVWHLDCATNLNPLFPEAIEMKEKLTGKEVTEVSDSTIRNFVRKAILEDIAPTTQPTAMLPELPPEQKKIIPTVSAAPAARPAFVAAVATTQPSMASHPLEIRVIGVDSPNSPTTQPLAGDSSQAKPLDESPNDPADTVVPEGK